MPQPRLSYHKLQLSRAQIVNVGGLRHLRPLQCKCCKSCAQVAFVGSVQAPRTPLKVQTCALSGTRLGDDFGIRSLLTYFDIQFNHSY